MGKLRVAGFSISLDGYGAGPGQSLENPMGIDGLDIHEWVFPTATFRQRVLGEEGGTTGVDDSFAARGFEGVGAWIMGRNMFGPVRGPWPDLDWTGWWGETPPFHTQVFVLTRHSRPSLEMAGGSVFHFITDGIEAALERALAAAGNKDVRLGGGVATVRQYLRAGLVDEMHLAIAPCLLGAGERLFDSVDLRTPGYRCVERVQGEIATHVVLRPAGTNGDGGG